MIKNLLNILVFLFFIPIHSQSINEELVRNKELKEVYKYCFMVDEFLLICENDSSFIKHDIFKRDSYKRTKGEEYYYDMSINMLKQNLKLHLNQNNKCLIKKLLLSLNANEPCKPDVNWGMVFETCQTCYFGTYPADRFTYFNFSLIFMGEKEINEMINYEDGRQWDYALMAIRGGDSFTLNKSQYGNDVLDRRIANYIINKWKHSKLPKIKKLISTFEEVML